MIGGSTDGAAQAQEAAEQQQQHGAPGEEAECAACLEDLDADSYAEYRATAGETIIHGHDDKKRERARGVFWEWGWGCVIMVMMRSESERGGGWGTSWLWRPSSIPSIHQWESKQASLHPAPPPVSDPSRLLLVCAPMAGGPWRPSPYCVGCVERLLAEQWGKYKEVRRGLALPWRGEREGAPCVICYVCVWACTMSVCEDVHT